VAACAVEAFGGWCGAFLHEVECEFTSEFDQAIVAGFGDDEYRLNLGADPCAAYMSVKTIAHFSNIESERTKLL
jgi:hypothetical protein